MKKENFSYLQLEEVTKLLRRYIEVNYKTQKAFAKHIGYSLHTVSAWATGKEPIAKCVLQLLDLEKVVLYKRIDTNVCTIDSGAATPIQIRRNANEADFRRCEFRKSSPDDPHGPSEISRIASYLKGR